MSTDVADHNYPALVGLQCAASSVRTAMGAMEGIEPHFRSLDPRWAVKGAMRELKGVLVALDKAEKDA